MKLLYEWGVGTVADGRLTKLSPVGISDADPRARSRMLAALETVPSGVTARGWVTVVAYLPWLGGYNRYYASAGVVREADGSVRWVTGP